MRNAFCGDYPDECTKQILHAIPKHGHTKKEPKLRGIAVAPFFARLYDSILNECFLLWYKPNYEQAGFRSGQGCCNQIFVLMMLIAHDKETKKNIYVCFLDYEKAFDYANRVSISHKLMDSGCGHNLVSALTKSMSKTVYHPKI